MIVLRTSMARTGQTAPERPGSASPQPPQQAAQSPHHPRARSDAEPGTPVRLFRSTTERTKLRDEGRTLGDPARRFVCARNGRFSAERPRWTRDAPRREGQGRHPLASRSREPPRLFRLHLRPQRSERGELSLRPLRRCSPLVAPRLFYGAASIPWSCDTSSAALLVQAPRSGKERIAYSAYCVTLYAESPSAIRAGTNGGRGDEASYPPHPVRRQGSDAFHGRCRTTSW